MAHKRLDAGKVSVGGLIVAGDDVSTALDGLTATAAELNGMCDVSAYTQAITAAGAVTADGSKRYVTLAGGAYAITLAAPAATAYGKSLVITYVGGDTDAVTLANTNMVGGSAGSTYTFNADNETLVLTAILGKWLVVKEHGVTIA